MAISTYGVQLMHKTSGSSYTKLVDIKSFPDLMGEPNMLETTTLSNGSQTYIPGIKQMENLQFTANYAKTDFETCKALEGTEVDFAVWFGAEGTDGKFEFKGKLSMGVNGGGVDEVIEMTLNIAPSTDITVA